MSLHLYLNGGRQSMDGGSKGALGLPRERFKLNGLKIDQYDNYTGGYHLRPDWHWTYSFDGRGQVTGARKRTVTNVSTGAAFLLGGWDAAYSYDDIGNRTTSRFGGDGQESSPVGSEEVGYEVNALNQYTEIENPRAFFVTGCAPAASTVGITLNGTAANRAVPHFWARQEVAGTGPIWADATLVATSGSSTVTVPKHTYVPPAVETPQYDADGNLVSDGRWLYAWDGENRLKEMTAQAAAVLGGVPELRLSYAYDGQSRRIRKLVEEKVSGSWVTRTDTRFMYDGWNLMAEVEYLGTAPDAPPATSAAPRPFLRRTYLWGQDLSGSLQGAGGVGGLLAMTRHDHGAVPSKDYWVTNDLNGNVIGLITENGVRALYEYDPFGKPLRVSEPEEDLNPFLFSTKYTDAETGLCYYGYRYYDAVRGRWINRDPIEEEGGANLYCMVDNDPVGHLDRLGLQNVEDISGTKCPEWCLYDFEIRVIKPDQTYHKQITEILKIKVKNFGKPLSQQETVPEFDSGHTWLYWKSVGLTSDDYAEEWGYYPSGSFFGSPGIIKSDKGSGPATHVRKYKLCHKTIRRIEEIVERDKLKPGTYNLDDLQCTTWAVRVMLGGGILENEVLALMNSKQLSGMTSQQVVLNLLNPYSLAEYLDATGAPPPPRPVK